MAANEIAIGVVAPACRIEPALADAVKTLAARLYPQNTPRIHVHAQCFATHGHFAGDDALRAAAFIETANDPALDAVWIARGGYGSGRIVERVLPHLTDAARSKTYMGYSDAGSLLGALYARGFPGCAHGPMPQDLRRDGGEAAVGRALAYLVDGDPAALEPTVVSGVKTAAFNLAILAALMGTPWQPDLADHVLMLEDVSEPMYRIDRMLLQVTSHPDIRRVRGLRLGRFGDIPDNDPDFAMTADAVARYWCERAGIAYLGHADIGHDAANKVVPFGTPGR